MSEQVDKNEIIRRLKDAGIYEDNIPEDLMVAYYKAIKNSETSLHEETENNTKFEDETQKSLNESAKELLEAINNSESVAPLTKNKNNKDFVKIMQSDDSDESLDAFREELAAKSKPVVGKKDEESNNNNNNVISATGENNRKLNSDDVVFDVKKTPIGFNDMPRSENIEENMLRITSHELKFINIQNSKKFLTQNSETRIRMLRDYHLAVARLTGRLARQSTIMAPLPKAITAIDHGLLVNPVIAALKDEELQCEESYISRSGRLTKRKVYNEADDSSEDSYTVSSKRSKNDGDWLSKSSPKTNKAVAKKSEGNNFDVDDSFTEKNDDPKEKETVKSRTSHRKLTNQDIIARSSLFHDRLSDRTKTIMKACNEEAETKKREEEQMKRFMRSLNTADSDSDDDDKDESNKIISIDDDSDAPERKRVVPPVPFGRRPIHNRKRAMGASAHEPLNITTTKRPTTGGLSAEEPKPGPAANGVARRAPFPRRASNADAKAESSGGGGGGRSAPKQGNTIPCPLCSLSFPKSEVEEHAATCGEDVFAQAPPAKLSRIMCEVCDQVVPLTTEYEVHVKKCIEKHRENQ